MSFFFHNYLNGYLFTLYLLQVQKPCLVCPDLPNFELPNFLEYRFHDIFTRQTPIRIKYNQNRWHLVNGAGNYPICNITRYFNDTKTAHYCNRRASSDLTRLPGVNTICYGLRI